MEELRNKQVKKITISDKWMSQHAGDDPNKYREDNLINSIIVKYYYIWNAFTVNTLNKSS